MERRDSGVRENRLASRLLPTRRRPKDAAVAPGDRPGRDGGGTVAPPATAGGATKTQQRQPTTTTTTATSAPGPSRPPAAGSQPRQQVRTAGAGRRRPDAADESRPAAGEQWDAPPAPGGGQAEPDARDHRQQTVVPPPSVLRDDGEEPAGRRGCRGGGNGVLGLLAICAVLGAVVLALSWLVGGLDLLAGGAVVGVWMLCVATRLVLGKHGRDWVFPPRADVREEFRALRRDYGRVFGARRARGVPAEPAVAGAAAADEFAAEVPPGLGAGAVVADRRRARAGRGGGPTR